MQVDEVKKQLIALESEVNSQSDSGFVHIEFDQQSVKGKNMSFTGGNVRIYVKPFTRLKKYEIALAGTAIEMYSFMRDLCRAECAGENHRGKTHPEPYWRVDDFEIVKKAVYQYARKPGTTRRAIEKPAPQAMSEAPENADRVTLISWLAENERRASTLPESDLFRRGDSMCHFVVISQ